MNELPPETAAHVWRPKVRQRQLRMLESLCGQIADLLQANGEPAPAERFRARAAMARRLLADGYDPAELNTLGGGFPDGAHWHVPKYADDGSRAPWQERVAKLYSLAVAVAQDLRSVATSSHAPDSSSGQATDR